MRKIKIAIDCRPLLSHRTGIGRYLFEIIRYLSKRDDDVEYYLYAPGDIDLPSECTLDVRFHKRIMRVRPALLWLHTIVPCWIWLDQIDVFWGPNYAMPLIKRAHCRYVITIHDLTHVRFPETMMWKTKLHNQFMLPRYCNSCDFIITDSHHSKSEIERFLGVTGAKIGVVPLSADHIQEVVGKPLGPTDESFILTVGTIEPRKNIEAVVRAYAGLPAEMQACYRLVLAGGQGWGGLDPAEWFKKHGVAERASYVGRVEDEVLVWLMRNSTLFIFPSFYEGFGLPLLEAMASGVPVISSFSSSLREVGGDGPVYFNPNDTQELGFKMEIVLSDLRLQECLRVRGVKRASQFSWQRAADRTIGLLLQGGV